MFDLTDPKTFWLNITNIMLGIATLACCVAVGYGVVQEVLARIRKSKTAPVISDDHAFVAPGLGITMADGGERVDKGSPAGSEKEQTIVLKLNQKHDAKK
jgi:hypothetical protein